MKTILETVHERALELWTKEGILDESITVTAAPLSVKEAIGTPEGNDFPIQKGKEKLMEANFRGARGQAFTDHYGNYSGTLAEISELPMDDNFHRAVFVSTTNAVCGSLGLTGNTVHCRDKGPAECAKGVFRYIDEQYGKCRVAIIGFQPALAQAVSAETDVRLVDLDPDNIGQTKRGVLVEGGETSADAIDWADLLLVTGTTLANGTIDMFLTGKPVLFYGTTIAGAAALMGFDRYCPQSS
ncbi:DUF364 domain-containing protein [Pseudodesulfovibrio thermohalotolerans]|uniref:Rossmann-like domain-containing protein n=1 Tax=Pseudodesulfovibrio thermohalotolerans TaxID=2880651 RepID=UPI0024429312|nr:DUF364 domain-containing protein [Pseudodesulfovibrio thermohalotolerans]WFS61201.1 DUF364 domain-containing protein [Pseudodesulfovibrio thermohalotolerans]